MSIAARNKRPRPIRTQPAGSRGGKSRRRVPLEDSLDAAAEEASTILMQRLPSALRHPERQVPRGFTEPPLAHPRAKKPEGRLHGDRFCVRDTERPETWMPSKVKKRMSFGGTGKFFLDFGF